MPTQLQFRRGTTSQNNGFTGAVGALSIDTDTDAIILHDGSAAGGIEIVPSGTIVAFGNTTAPTGWKVCNDAAISRTTFARLFAVIGTSFGTGDGSSTFNLPDLQGRTAIGSGSGSGLSSRSLGATGGFETTQSGSNLGSGSDFSNSLMQPFTVVNFFIATGL